MGKGGKVFTESTAEVRQRKITWKEVGKHKERNDQWVVIHGKAYDVTEFSKKHPGGARILNHYAGEDATDAFTAFHNDKEKVCKFLNPLYVGDVADTPCSQIQSDFRELRQVVEKKGWMIPDPLFYVLHLIHVIVLEGLAVSVFYWLGTGWAQILLATLLMVVSQAQAGWSMHDYGHHSVFPDRLRSHIAHHLIIGFIKGASSHWWNFRHFQHHAKPNKVRKDPDVDMGYVFLVGNQIPVELGRKKKGFLPYQWQHKYFFLVGPPLLLPIYFHFEILYFCVKRRDILDLSLLFLFGVRWYLLFGPFFGFYGALLFYLGVRVIESHWFTWCTQMSHLTEDITRDTTTQDWPTMQVKSSVNVEPSFFTNWFTGHLNYQIEHHLFPTMPRSSFHKAQPLVKSFCKRHGLEYTNKSLYNAFADVVKMLENSGQLWYDAYHE